MNSQSGHELQIHFRMVTRPRNSTVSVQSQTSVVVLQYHERQPTCTSPTNDGGCIWYHASEHDRIPTVYDHANNNFQKQDA